MSLVQHVSAVEGTDRVDLASLYEPDNASLLGRRLSLTLSYDPRPPAPATEKLKPEGAYKVSTAKRMGKSSPSSNNVAHLPQPRSPLA